MVKIALMPTVMVVNVNWGISKGRPGYDDVREHV